MMFLLDFIKLWNKNVFSCLWCSNLLNVIDPYCGDGLFTLDWKHGNAWGINVANLFKALSGFGIWLGEIYENKDCLVIWLVQNLNVYKCVLLIW